MSKLKKLLAVLVCAAMALALAPGLTVCASEAGVTDDGLKYEVYNDYVKIIQYTGSATEITIPAEIEGKPVTGIGDWVFKGCENLKSVNIPDGVTYITDYIFEGCSSLEEINIDTNNANYASRDGVLFNKEMTALLLYPAGNKRTSYDIPDSVTSIYLYAFEGCINLKSLTIPGNVKNGFADSRISISNSDMPSTPILFGNIINNSRTSLAEINVDVNNNWFASRDGVLFDKEMTTLLLYPAGNKRTGYDIPDGVTSVVEYAFKDCSSLTSVSIPDSVTNIAGSAFEGCTDLTDIYYGGSADDWNKISNNNYNILNANIHYNSTGPVEIKVLVNGTKIAFDVPPIILDGTTMLPVRMALNPMGAEFVWDGEARTVTITAKGKTVVLTVDSDVATVDGAAKTMLRPAMIMDGRTLIPIRFVAEALDYEVGWDGETQTVTIDAR